MCDWNPVFTFDCHHAVDWYHVVDWYTPGLLNILVSVYSWFTGDAADPFKFDNIE
jgi:hypothetical protein